ncbi:MAG: hypothetical protein JO011_13725 [Ktedonobacteraceae bacterium]|nr:hypothetical protein [Ktedonobacteraceae bacterium]
MSELPLVQHRIQTLRRYMSALECGDADTIAAVLEDAGQDRGLERMILEVNAVYQHEDSTIVRAADAAAAQQKLLKLADQTIGREEMQNYSLHNEENPAHAALHTTQADSSNNTNSPTAKKLQGRKFATPVFPAKMVASQKWYSSRKGWIAASAAAVLIAILLLPGTSALANQFLSLFTVKNFQPVQVTNQDVVALSQYSAPRIDDLGNVQFQASSFHTHNNLTKDQAAKNVKFSIVLPRQLPDGVANSPSFSVIEGGHGVFTFSSAKMHAYLVKNGHGNVKIPANLDGATFDVTMTPGVLIKYGYHGGNPFLGVELPSPVIRATGSASLEQLRDFMLSLPGLPPSLVAQLKQINFNNGTIPLPVPAGIDAHSVTVNGTSGVLLSSNKATTVENVKGFPAGSMIVWQTKGIIYAFGGIATSATQLVAAANSI